MTSKINTRNGISDGRKVLVPAEGHNYHLFDDCYGIRLGRTFHAEMGHEFHGDVDFTVGDAVSSGKYACRVCYKRAGLPIPPQADRVAIRAEARAQREAAKAEKLAAAEAKAEAARIATINHELAVLFSTIGALLVERRSLEAVA